MNQKEYSEEIVDLRRLYGCARQIIWTFPICCLLLFSLISVTRNSGDGTPATHHNVSYFDFRSETDALGFLNQNFPVYPTLSMIILGFNNEKSEFRTRHSSVIVSMNISMVDGSSTSVRIETTSLKSLDILPVVSSIETEYERALINSMKLFLRASGITPVTGMDSDGLQARRQYIVSLQGNPRVSVVQMTLADSVDEITPSIPAPVSPIFKSLVFSIIAGCGLWLVCVVAFTYLKKRISGDFDIFSVMGDVKVISFSDFLNQQDRSWALGILASADYKKSQLMITGLSPEVNCLEFVDFLTALIPVGSYLTEIVPIESPWSSDGASLKNDSELIVVVSRSTSRRKHLKLARDYCEDFLNTVPLMVICP